MVRYVGVNAGSSRGGGKSSMTMAVRGRLWPPSDPRRADGAAKRRIEGSGPPAPHIDQRRGRPPRSTHTRAPRAPAPPRQSVRRADPRAAMSADGHGARETAGPCRESVTQALGCFAGLPKSCSGDHLEMRAEPAARLSADDLPYGDLLSVGDQWELLRIRWLADGPSRRWRPGGIAFSHNGDLFTTRR